MVNSTTNPGDHQLHALITIVKWAVLLLILAAIIRLITYISVRLLRKRQQENSKCVLLELTPPISSDKTPLATTKLLGVLHELASPRNFIGRFLQRQESFSLEVVSSRTHGIRYVIQVSTVNAPILQRYIAAYLPGVKIRKIKNYMNLLSKSTSFQVTEFKQTGHPLLPLSILDSLDQHDPIAYLTGSMTQLARNDLIILQMVLTPRSSTSFRQWPDRDPISNRSALLSHNYSRRIIQSSIRLLLRVVTFGQSILLDPSKSHAFTAPEDMGDKAAGLENKLNQPLFQANIRLLVSAKDKKTVTQRVRAVESSMASFDRIGTQSLRAKQRWPYVLKERLQVANLQKRSLSIWPRNSSILSSSEISDIYHFPNWSTTQTENLITSLSRSLPAPVSLKGNQKLDVLLGVNNHHGIGTPIGLSAAERERHVYVIGGTGNGKTTLLQYAAEQDIRNGKGLAIIDPHGDLAESILKRIPKSRIKDVIYFNPDDVSHPMGLNLLELSASLSGDELLREKDRITETVISVFRKIFSEDDNGGHRIEYVLRNTIQTALTIEDATIFTIFHLLTNGRYRQQAVANLEDQNLRDFWNNEMGKAGEFQRIKMSAGITAKVGRFLFSGTARRTLGQAKSTIDFDDIINSGKILICNFSKGLLGEDTAALFGITVLAKLQIATLHRARIDSIKRRPFYLYVDEFQNFATMSFVQLLSEARKYKLFLTMAEQSTSQQQEQRIVQIILANVGTVICFRSANPMDEQYLLPQFAPFIAPGEISYLAPFHFFIRIAAALSQEPFSGETIRLSTSGSQAVMQQVIEASRSSYAMAEDDNNPLSDAFIDKDDYELDSPLAIP